MKPLVKLTLIHLGVGLLTIGAAQAQSTTARTGSSYSVLPGTNNGYFGIDVGKPRYKLGCGPGVFSCDDPSSSFHIYTGGLFNEWAGLELGYLHLGNADRFGGTARAQGINLSLVGRVPISQPFSVFGKLGTTYGRTKVSANSLSGAPTGSDSGWGASYGAGVGYDFSSTWGVVAQWDRNKMKFIGRGRQDVDTTSIGIKVRF
ncbi:MAG: outer membrane beta-barrel protein [Burkholderiales bacterium]|nr:outer membrane beta-barrel protein [Burkholderiales bacterium]